MKKRLVEKRKHPNVENLAKENNFFNGEFSFEESQYESALSNSVLNKSEYVENIGNKNENYCGAKARMKIQLNSQKLMKNFNR